MKCSICGINHDLLEIEYATGGRQIMCVVCEHQLFYILPPGSYKVVRIVDGVEFKIEEVEQNG